MEGAYDLVGDGINLDKVDPIHQKRLLTFINFWLSNISKFVNHTALQCESLLQNVDRDLQRLEASMVLLESKLASIPSLASDVVKSETTGVTKVSNTKPLTVEINEKNEIPTSDVKQSSTVDVTQTDQISNTSSKTENVPSNETDPRYSKYFKMLKMGIPILAVKQKMEMEGMDASVLDNPDSVPVTVVQGKTMADDKESDAEDSASTASSFSD